MQTQRSVKTSVEQTLTGQFQSLLLTHPRAAIEFVRKARLRSHRIFGGANRVLLADAGLIALGQRDCPVHDVWRDFVAKYVVDLGFGLGVHSHNPTDGHCLCQVVALRNRLVVNKELVDALYKDFEALHHGDPISFAELVRKVRIPAHRPYGRIGETLTALGYFDFSPVAHDRLKGAAPEPLHFLQEVQAIAKDPTAVVVHDVVCTLLPLCVTGERGLGIQLRKPYNEVVEGIRFKTRNELEDILAPTQTF